MKTRLLLNVLAFAVGTLAFAQNPPAITVPFTATNTLSPHTSWSGNTVTLKGSMLSCSGTPAVCQKSPLWGTDTFTYDWDPGDGGTHCTGNVTDPYSIACTHTYTGTVGETFTAVLTVTDTMLSTKGPNPSVNCPPTITTGACYYTTLAAPPPNLPVEVNNAIDNGLWYLHQNMNRTHDTTSGNDYGDWYTCNNNHVDECYTGYRTGATGENCVAFENSGFLQTSPGSPYQDDVRRCINSVFNFLTTTSIPNSKSNIIGAYDPDQNGNGIGVSVNEYYTLYQTGMMMDAVAATGTPNTAVPAGTNLANAIKNAGIKGTGSGGAYTYKDAMFDMVDFYSYCQNPSSSAAGGWRYQCNDDQSDNSPAQWAAIGIIPARRVLGSTYIPEVQKANENWLGYSFTNLGTPAAPDGYFGYTDNSPIWGPFADTPSAMVQLALDGLGRGQTLPNLTDDNGHSLNNTNNGIALWDAGETYMRDNFGNPTDGSCANDDNDQGNNDATKSPKCYIYGLFSFTKAMLLHSNDGIGAVATPLQLLQSSDNPANTPIDWYGAQSATYGGSDPTDGVARWLVSIQNSDGSWYGQNFFYYQSYLETGFAISMLNKTVFQPVPVACAHATPNPVANGGPVLLDGSCSVDQNPANQIVSWQWDTTGDGGTNFNIQPGNAACKVPSCVKVTQNFTAPPGKTPPPAYNYPVRLRVTDNATPPLTADIVFNVVINAPPNPPTANAGGPYNFCSNKNSNTGGYIYGPWYLDGSHSTNPDEGKTDGTMGAPTSTICNPAATASGNDPNACGYYWDFSCSGNYSDATGPQVYVTGSTSFPVGSNFNVCLKVVNNDNLAFPTAGLAMGLSSSASASVFVHSPTDENCTHCVSSLSSKAKAPAPGNPGYIGLYWNDTNTTAFPIDHYNVYRSTNADFSNYVQIAGANSIYSLPAVKVPATQGSVVYFQDNNVVGGKTYYYRVAPATNSDTETCGSNVTLQVTLPKGRS